MTFEAATTYEKIDPKALAALRAQHAWIVEPIYRASDKGIDLLPKFDLEGNLISADKSAH